MKHPSEYLTRLTWEMKQERTNNDYLDGYAPTTLYARQMDGKHTQEAASLWGMQVGDWELLSFDERTELMEWEELLQQDLTTDLIN